MAQATKKRKPRGASRRVPAKKNVPAWLWLLMGVFLGAGMMLLLPVGSDQGRHSQAKSLQDHSASSTQGRDTNVDPKASYPKPIFDFYTELSRKASGASSTTHQTTTTKKKALKPAATAQYILQAGSFRRAADADNLRARLLLVGLPASVQRLKAPSGHQWYRVQVGPFTDKTALQSAKKTLQAQGLKPLVLKLDD